MDEIQTEENMFAPLYEELATVTVFIMPYEADIVRSLLESEEIPVFLMDYHTIYIKWFYAIALGGIKLQVHKNDVALANEIIQSALLEGQHQASESGEGACPVCGGIIAAPVVFGRRWAVLSWLIVGIPLVWPWIRLRCSECGTTWRDLNRSAEETEAKPN